MNKQTAIQTAFAQAMAATEEIPAKQKQVLAASLALFAEQGFANTTTKEIAEQAGVAEGTVYRRYHTKEALLAALLQPVVRQVVPTLMQEFAHQVMQQTYPSRRQFLQALLTNRAEFLQGNWREIKILLNEMLVRDDLRTTIIQEATPVLRDNLYPLLDHLRQAGELVAWPNDLVSQFLIGTVMTNLLRANLQGDLRTFSQRIPYLVDFLDRGLAPGKADNQS